VLIIHELIIIRNYPCKILLYPVINRDTKKIVVAEFVRSY